MSRLRSFWELFWGLIDSDSIRPFVNLYYAPLLVFSVVAIVFMPAPIDNPMVGDLPVEMWVWVQMGATTAAMTGLALRHGGTSVADMSTLQLRRDWFGLCLQAGGHAAMCVMLLEFEIAVGKFLASGALPISTLIWWLLAFGCAAISSYVIGTGLLALQCLRKIHKGLKLAASV